MAAAQAATVVVAVAGAPSVGLGHTVPLRVALSATALGSPVLMVRLWAVKDLGALFAEAGTLTTDDAGGAFGRELKTRW